jgi:hypothetical protein
MTIHIKPKNKICYLCGKKFGIFTNFWFNEDCDYDIGPRQETDEGIEYRYITKMWHKQCALDNVEMHRKKKNEMR